VGKVCSVFIDGEKLFDVLVQEAASSVTETWERLRAYWYLISSLEFYPYSFPKDDDPKLQRLLSRHVPYSKELSKLKGEALAKRMKQIVEQLLGERSKMRRRFDGWGNLQRGIATRYRSIEFRRAGTICYNLFDRTLGPEKAVDVKLASDLIVLKDIYDVALIVSGDQD